MGLEKNSLNRLMWRMVNVFKMTDESNDSQIKVDHDLLVSLNTKFDVWMDEFRRISNGVGFPRCVQREGRMAALEKDMAEKAWRDEIISFEKRLTGEVQSLANSIRWMRNTFFGGTAVFALIGLAWAVIELIIKN